MFFQLSSGDQNYLKRINRLHILNTLRTRGCSSKTQLARLSGLNNKTITNIINYLQSKRIIESAGMMKTDNGRTKEHFRLSKDDFFSIGIDLGASHISAILINLEGQVLLEKSYSFRYGLKGPIILEKMLNLTEQLFSESSVDPERVLGIGFTAPGFFDKEQGIWKLAINISEWEAVPIEQVLKSRFHTDIYLQDCSRSMALAEMWFGAGRNHDNFILIDLGQGIGMGMVINGALYEGSNLKSGEIGHLVVDPEGRKCTCGNRGCLESAASGTAIEATVRDKLHAGAASKARDLVNDHIDELSVIDVVEAANLGDALCVEVLEKAGRMLGRAISHTINLLNPELIIIGGQLANAGSYLSEPLLGTTRQLTLPQLFSDVTIEFSKLGPLSASLGAANIAVSDKIFSL